MEKVELEILRPAPLYRGDLHGDKIGSVYTEHGQSGLVVRLGDGTPKRITMTGRAAVRVGVKGGWAALLQW